MKIKMNIADLVTLLTMTSQSRANEVIERYNIGIEKIKVIEKALQQDAVNLRLNHLCSNSSVLAVP